MFFRIQWKAKQSLEKIVVSHTWMNANVVPFMLDKLDAAKLWERIEVSAALTTLSCLNFNRQLSVSHHIYTCNGKLSAVYRIFIKSSVVCPMNNADYGGKNITCGKEMCVKYFNSCVDVFKHYPPKISPSWQIKGSKNMLFKWLRWTDSLRNVLSVPTIRKNPINLMNVTTQVPSLMSGCAIHSVLHIVVHSISHTTVVLCSTLQL